jgi:hypothetical protein
MSLIVLPIPYETETLKDKISELNGVILLDGVMDKEVQKVFNHFYKGKVDEETIKPLIRHLPDLIKEKIISKSVKPYLIGVHGLDKYGNNSTEINKQMYKNIKHLLEKKEISDATLLIAEKNNFFDYITDVKKGKIQAIELSTPSYVNELNNT